MLRRIVVTLALVVTYPAAGQETRRWIQIWADEFNAPANTPPDSSKWTYDEGGGGWGNRELESYTNRLENAFHDGAGHLVIRAIRTGDGGYTSARLKTLDRFAPRYGLIEARIQLPYGQGIWPAFWLLGADMAGVGWPRCGEIDIMENIGKEPGSIHGTVHGPGYSGGNGIGHRFELPPGQRFAGEFHVFAIEWLPQHIVFKVDQQPYFEVTPALLPPGAEWVFDHPFFLLLNLAVGGSWPGNPDSTTVFPQDMLIDWIRVAEAPRKGHAIRP